MGGEIPGEGRLLPGGEEGGWGLEACRKRGRIKAQPLENGGYNSSSHLLGTWDPYPKIERGGWKAVRKRETLEWGQKKKKNPQKKNPPPNSHLETNGT